MKNQSAWNLLLVFRLTLTQQFNKVSRKPYHKLLVFSFYFYLNSSLKTWQQHKSRHARIEMRYSLYMQLHQPIQSSLTLSTHRQPSFWSIWLALRIDWMVQWPVEICLVATQTADFGPFLVFVIGRHMMFAAYKRFIIAKWKVFRLRFLSNNESRRKLCKKHNKVKKNRQYTFRLHRSKNIKWKLTAI